LKSLLTAEAYISQAWFEREEKMLFTPLWQFVAPKMLLCVPDAFVTRKLAGIDIVVQNFDGDLRAFRNVCLHRQSPLQNEPNGVRPLVCPYHAWRYGSDGGVTHIPFHDECYQFDPDTRQGLQLEKYSVFEFGKLIFVNLSSSPMNFYDQFDQASLEGLKQASEIFDDEILVTKFECDFNWKLAYENLRDSLHPRFVHNKTLYQNVKFQANVDPSQKADEISHCGSGSRDTNEHLQTLRGFSGGGKNEPMPNLPRYPWHDFVERYGEDDWYLNWLVYPNLHIASGSGGYSFIIEHHIPVSADKTDLWVYYVTGRKKRSYPTSTAVLLSHLQGAVPVLAEDIDVMNGIQSALSPSSPVAELGAFEYASLKIERWYLDVLEGRYAL
jgi:phenylpropionate dioxygenase-like ring-hydroxylating dioxygenase large terminal subunit